MLKYFDFAIRYSPPERLFSRAGLFDIRHSKSGFTGVTFTEWVSNKVYRKFIHKALTAPNSVT
jgi:hypothetical protein